MIDLAILDRLNAPTPEERLENLRALLPEAGFPPVVPRYINNHIHTIYSFSPYSPAAGPKACVRQGLSTTTLSPGHGNFWRRRRSRGYLLPSAWSAG